MTNAELEARIERLEYIVADMMRRLVITDCFIPQAELENTRRAYDAKANEPLEYRICRIESEDTQ